MFKVGDKVKITSFPHVAFGRCGIVKTVNGNGFYYIETNNLKFLCYEDEIERIEDMDISERLSEVIKENQNLKQQISEQNIKLNKIQGDINRELRDKQGVSDEEFEEVYEFFSGSNKNVHATVWGNLYLENIFSNLSLSEFVSKYKEYKDKQDNEIRVGDVVNDGNTVAIVTCAYEKSIYVLFRDGSCGSYPKYEYIKTGKHYDSIDEFMNS